MSQTHSTGIGNGIGENVVSSLMDLPKRLPDPKVISLEAETFLHVCGEIRDLLFWTTHLPPKDHHKILEGAIMVSILLLSLQDMI